MSEISSRILYLATWTSSEEVMKSCETEQNKEPYINLRLDSLSQCQNSEAVLSSTNYYIVNCDQRLCKKKNCKIRVFICRDL